MRLHILSLIALITCAVGCKPVVKARQCIAIEYIGFIDKSINPIIICSDFQSIVGSEIEEDNMLVPNLHNVPPITFENITQFIELRMRRPINDTDAIFAVSSIGSSKIILKSYAYLNKKNSVFFFEKLDEHLANIQTQDTGSIFKMRSQIDIILQRISLW